MPVNAARPDRDTEGGAILVLTALVMIALIGFAALAIDSASAWSTRRLAQNNVDMAALSAVTAIPQTYRAGGTPTPVINIGIQVSGSRVFEEVRRISIANRCPAPCTMTSNIDQVGDDFELNVALNSEARHSFAPVIGAGSAIIIQASASAAIIANHPELDVVPIGFTDAGSGTRYRCLYTSTTPQSACSTAGHHMIGIGNRNTVPACDDRVETAVYHLRNGYGFLIDIDQSGSSRPDSDSACRFGHDLTMPTGARRLFPVNSTVVTDGLATGRLAGNTTMLWDLLPDGPVPNACDKKTMQDTASGAGPTGVADVNTASALMRTCLTSFSPTFTLAGDWHDRLVWAIHIDSTGKYRGWRPIWLHTYLDNAGKESMTPIPNPQGFTFFMVDPASFSGAGDAFEYDPGGLDNLDFELID